MLSFHSIHYQQVVLDDTLVCELLSWEREIFFFIVGIIHLSFHLEAGSSEVDMAKQFADYLEKFQDPGNLCFILL